MAQYHYTQSGLENVYLSDINPIMDDAGHAVVSIPAVGLLHTTIAVGIISHENAMSGKELRFLRTELGMTQGELAEVVRSTHQSIGRWERGEKPIDEKAEVIVRLFAIKHLIETVKRYESEYEIDVSQLVPKLEVGVDEISKRVTRSTQEQTIEIRATSGGYELEAA